MSTDEVGLSRSSASWWLARNEFVMSFVDDWRNLEMPHSSDGTEMYTEWVTCWNVKPRRKCTQRHIRDAWPACLYGCLFTQSASCAIFLPFKANLTKFLLSPVYAWMCVCTCGQVKWNKRIISEFEQMLSYPIWARQGILYCKLIGLGYGSIYVLYSWRGKEECDNVNNKIYRKEKLSSGRDKFLGLPQAIWNDKQ